jgi:hypothetical protein
MFMENFNASRQPTLAVGACCYRQRRFNASEGRRVAVLAFLGTGQNRYVEAARREWLRQRISEMQLARYRADMRAAGRGFCAGCSGPMNQVTVGCRVCWDRAQRRQNRATSSS